MTSLKELRDVGVQAGSPMGSKLNGSHSYMGSHSILGSPPGSLLNLRSSVGSQSNLVSSSSSMFQLDSLREDGEDGEDDTVWESSSPPAEFGGRRRSCLKVQREEWNVGAQRDTFARRSSMKQVQWDEDGMTWDVYGACLDPEELNTAIQRHLQLKTKEIRETRHSIGSAAMTGTMATTPKTPTAPGTPAMTTTAIETGAEETRGLVGKVELGGEECREGEGGGGEGEGERDGGGGGDGEREEKGGAEAGGTPMLQRKSSSCDSGRVRKKSGVVMRTLKKPVCCVRSSKAHD